jgi:hypothetical protein
MWGAFWSKRIVVFTVGLAAGIGVSALVRSGTGRKACVAVVSQGLKLQKCAATALECAKENVEDIVAEAKYATERSDQPEGDSAPAGE